MAYFKRFSGGQEWKKGTKLGREPRGNPLKSVRMVSRVMMEKKTMSQPQRSV